MVAFTRSCLPLESPSLLDIVPFGGVAEKGDFIEWPPDRSFKMSVVGFRECYQHVVQIKISDKAEVAINVVSLAGLTILKLISWDENSDRRHKDASDLFFIIQNYLDAGNLERLFDEAPDIVDSGDYNYEAGSARLLGRDISKFAFSTTKAKLIEILKRESQWTYFRVTGLLRNHTKKLLLFSTLC